MVNFKGVKRATHKMKASAGQNSMHNQENNKGSKRLWLAGLLVFSLVASVSFVYAIPASWMLEKANQNGLMAKTIQLTQPQGTWWHGQAQLALVDPMQTTHLGKIQWQLSVLGLLSLNLNADVNLRTKSGGVRGNLSTGLLNQEQIEVLALEGQLPLSDLQPLLPNAYRNLGELQGQLALEGLGLVWDSTLNWITEINGSLQFSQLDIMGVTFPQLALTPVLQNNHMRIDALGGGQGWRLTGQALLDLKTYQADFKIEADNPNTLPDWTELVMQKKSPVLATLTQTGRR